MNDATRDDETMPGEDAEPRLAAWLAGDLAGESAEERALLAERPELAAEMARHRELRAALRELPAELAPDRDLWPEVAARIARGGGRTLPGRWRRLAVPLAALAAALAVAIGAAWFLRPGPSPDPAGVPAVAAAPSGAPPRAAAPPQGDAGAGEPLARVEPLPEGGATASPGARRRRAAPPAIAGGGASTPIPVVPPPVPPPASAPAFATPAFATPALAAYAETDRQLAALGAELRRSIEAQQERLPPETRRVVFDNLATIERALAEIEAALAGAPGDVELARTYIDYRQREIAVLRRANAMAARL